MSLVRLIIIALAIWLTLYTLRRLFKHLAPPNKATGGPPKDMVRCVQCGLHLPEAEAVSSQGQYYCCQEHRRQHTSPP